MQYEGYRTPDNLSPPSMQDGNDLYFFISDQSEIDETTSQGAFGGKIKVLVINRLVKKENSEEKEWKSEVIHDGRVINAYLRYRKLVHYF